jgi:hypothetical protein
MPLLNFLGTLNGKMSVTEPITTPTLKAGSVLAEADYPGKRLGVIGLILACVVGVVGLLVSVVALVLSLRARHRNPPAVAGIVIGVLATSAFIGGMWYFLELFLDK